MEQAEIEQLRGQLTEAAAFLDQMADALSDRSTAPPRNREEAAADCRAMANRLRGEA